MRALEMGAAEVTIVWENYEKQRYVLMKSNGEKVVLHLTEQEWSKLRADYENNSEAELVECCPFLEWLANNYKTFGTTLEIITNRSQEGNMFVEGFDGIGGLLRYRVEFETMNLANDLDDLDLGEI